MGPRRERKNKDVERAEKCHTFERNETNTKNQIYNAKARSTSHILVVTLTLFGIWYLVSFFSITGEGQDDDTLWARHFHCPNGTDKPGLNETDYQIPNTYEFLND